MNGESLSVGQRVKITGFTSYPKSKYNNTTARILAFNERNGKVVARLEVDNWLVLINARHVIQIVDNESTSERMDELNTIWAQDCAICLTNLKSTPRIQTHCTHVFHEACFMKWLDINNGCATCPLCRRAVVESKPFALRVKTIDNVCQTYSLKFDQSVF